MDDARETRPDHDALQRNRARVLFMALGGVLLAGLSLAPQTPVLVWNVSPSIAPGLYRVVQAPPRRGDILVIRPGQDLSSRMGRLGEALAGHVLLKPLAVLSGETICRAGAIVTLEGHPVAKALEPRNGDQRLPSWSGCRRLGANEVAILSAHPRSLDSRYFGPVPMSDVIGLARPVLTFASGPEDR
ncbi:MAG: S26 family signal peptidase [Hyphomonadaceae bacterium]